MEKQRILIVDDEEVNRAILGVIFRSTYEIVEASNGQEAIEQIKQNPNLALVCLDVVMPVLDGFGVLEYMKEQKMLETVPAILITGETVRDSEDRAYAYGIADVMHKPFYPDIVKRRASNIIELYQHKNYMETRSEERRVGKEC